MIGRFQEEGEDIMDMDRIDADYVAIPELDTYDDADLDRREYGQMDFSDRRAAERELAERYFGFDFSSACFFL